MAISLDALWKGATDEEIVQALDKWTSTNEEGQRVLAAEVKRRGLKVAVPEIVATPVNASAAAHASSGASHPFTPKALLIIAVVLVLVIVLARLT
jgi:hypothetical protein